MARRRTYARGGAGWEAANGQLFTGWGGGPPYASYVSVDAQGTPTGHRLTRQTDGWCLGEEFMGRTLGHAIDNAGKRIMDDFDRETTATDNGVDRDQIGYVNGEFADLGELGDGETARLRLTTEHGATKTIRVPADQLAKIKLVLLGEL